MLRHADIGVDLVDVDWTQLIGSPAATDQRKQGGQLANHSNGRLSMTPVALQHRDLLCYTIPTCCRNHRISPLWTLGFYVVGEERPGGQYGKNCSWHGSQLRPRH